MNVDQLKKNVGSAVRLRPLPQRVNHLTGGALLPEDDNWTIVRIEGSAVRLQNHRTAHVVDLGNDNIREFRTPDFLLLRCQLTLTGTDVVIEPVVGAGVAGDVDRQLIVLAKLVLGEVARNSLLNVQSNHTARTEASRNDDRPLRTPATSR